MRKVLYILGQFEDEDVAWLSRAGRRRDLSAKELLIEKDKPLSEIFILLTGSLSVSLSGREIAELEPGEVVGEMSLIDKRPPSATVIAGQSACVLAIDQAAMRGKLEQDFKFAARFYKAIAMFLSSRLRATTTQFGDHTAADLEDEDEIDLDVLDNVHLAGIRFEQILTDLLRATTQVRLG